MIEAIRDFFRRLFGAKPEPVKPEPTPEPTKPEPTPEPLPVKLIPPKITGYSITNAHDLITVNYNRNGLATVQSCIVTNNKKTARVIDASSPLVIGIGSDAAKGLTVVDGAFVGPVSVSISSEYEVAQGKTERSAFDSVSFVVPPLELPVPTPEPEPEPEPVKPEPEPVIPPVEPEPEPNPPAKQISLSKFKDYQRGAVKATGKKFDEFRINPNINCKRGAHPSTNFVNEDLSKIVVGDAGVVLDIETLISTRGESGRVGQFITQGKNRKWEFHPTDPERYIYINDRSEVIENRLGAFDHTILLDLVSVNSRFGLSANELVSGYWELGLSSKEGWVFVRTDIQGGFFYVVAFNILSKVFASNFIKVKARNGEPDYIGAFGNRSAVLKNIKQHTENWHDPYDFFYVDIDLNLIHKVATKKGMYHSGGFVDESGFDVLRDVAGRVNTPTAKNPTIEARQSLVSLNGHIGAVKGCAGAWSGYSDKGSIIIGDSDGGLYGGSDAIKDGYICGFVFQGEIYALVTKAQRNVWVRKVS